MGLGDLLGSGKQEAKTKIADYIRQPAADIGTSIGAVFKRRGQRGGPINSQQEAALRGIEAEAREGNPLLGDSEGFLSGIFGQGGLTGQQQQLAGDLTGGRFVNPAMGGYGEAAAGGYVNPALQEAQRVATGGDVGRNPYLEDTFNRAANVVSQQFREGTVPSLDRSALSQGRLGSNAYANARNRAEESYGRNLNDLATTVFGGAYEQDRNRQAGALNTFGQLGEGAIDTRLQGLAGQAGLGQQDVQNRLQGAGLYQQGTQNLFGATSALPQLQDLRYDDEDRLFSAGTTRQDLPYAEAGRAGRALQGLPFGQTTTQSQQLNPLTQGIGLTSGLLGLGGQIAGTAALFSDRRLKTDIAPIGRTDGGTPLYSYRYLWDDEDVRREGVMAQEAPAEAVIVTPSGWLAVDYARIT